MIKKLHVTVNLYHTPFTHDVDHKSTTNQFSMPKQPKTKTVVMSWHLVSFI